MYAVKKYLMQIRDADERIRAKHEEIERLRAQVEGLSCEIKERVQSSVAKDTMCASVAKIMDLEKEYAKDKDASIALRAKIIGEIELITDARYRRVLIERYVNMKTWERIAVDMSYSIRVVYKLHGKALFDFEKVCSKVQSDV